MHPIFIYILKTMLPQVTGTGKKVYHPPKDLGSYQKFEGTYRNPLQDSRFEIPKVPVAPVVPNVPITTKTITFGSTGSTSYFSLPGKKPTKLPPGGGII